MNEQLLQIGERLRALLPMLHWRSNGDALWFGSSSEGTIAEVSVDLHRVVAAAYGPATDRRYNINLPYHSENELVGLLTKWRDSAYPKRAKAESDPAAELRERLEALLPMLRWQHLPDGWDGKDDSGYTVVFVSPGNVAAWTRQQLGPNHPHALNETPFANQNELIALLTKWRDATYPQPVEPKVDPIAERGERLKALLPMLRWSLNDGTWTACDSSNRWIVRVHGNRFGAWTKEQFQAKQHLLTGEFSSEDELFQTLTKWRDATYPQQAERRVDEAMTPRIPKELRSLLDRMREAAPELQWSTTDCAVIAKNQHPPNVVSANPNKRLMCWVKDASEPHAINVPYPGDDEAVRLVREWWSKVRPAPPHDPIAERGERLRALLPMLQWERSPTSFLGYGPQDVGVISVEHDNNYVQAFLLKKDGGRLSIAKRFPNIDELYELIAKEIESPETQSEPNATERRAHLIDRIRRECPSAAVVLAGDQSLAVCFEDRPRFPFTLTQEGWRSNSGTFSDDEVVERVCHYARTTGIARRYAVITDAGEAAWRTAGSQFVKLAREPLVGLLTRHLAPNDEAFRGRLAAFLETEIGTALFASMLSLLLSTMPQTTGDVPQRLARELRVRAMANASDVLADVLTEPLRQALALYLQDPQAAPQLNAPQTASMQWTNAEEKVAT